MLSQETTDMLVDFLTSHGRGTSIISADGEKLIDPTSWALPSDGEEVHVLTHATFWLCGACSSSPLNKYKWVSYQPCETCGTVTVHYAI